MYLVPLLVIEESFWEFDGINKKMNKLIYTKVSIKDVGSHVEKYFDKDLLKSDFAFGDSLRKERKHLDKAINFFKSKRMSPQKKEKCEKLILELEMLYEQAVEKEKQKKETSNKTQGLFYYIEMPRKTDANIYFGFRFDRVKNPI